MRGEWITFAELCERVPTKSGTTLRRYTKERLISSRQLKRGGRVEYNWKTVERELAVLESHGVNAHLVAMTELPPAGPPDLVKEIAELRAVVTAIARKVGAA